MALKLQKLLKERPTRGKLTFVQTVPLVSLKRNFCSLSAIWEPFQYKNSKSNLKTALVYHRKIDASVLMVTAIKFHHQVLYMIVVFSSILFLNKTVVNLEC